MSKNDKDSRGLSYFVVPSKMSMIQKIQPKNSNCDACQAVSVKIITNEDIKSANLNRSACVCGPAEFCECKDIPSKMSAQEAIQLVHTSCEDCKAYLLNNEEIHLSTVNFSSEAISINTEPHQSQSSNYETHVPCEGCPTEMSPNEKIYSRSSLCNCQAMHAKMLNTEEINFSTPNLRSQQTLSPKTLSNQSQLPSYENNIACEGCSKNFVTVAEIHSKSNIIDSLLENMLTSENIEKVPQSSSNETLTKQLLSDSDYKINQNPSPRCKTRVACELSAKMLINEAIPLASLSCSNEGLSTKTPSDLSQLFGCETNNDGEGYSTKMFTDKEIHSRTSSDALLRNLSTIEDIQRVSQSSTKGALAKKVLSDSNHRIGQSQSSRCKTCIGCELSTKILTNEAFPLAASSFSNEAIFTETSDHSHTLSGDARILNPPTDTSTDEDSYSRSSVCDALLKKILSYDEIHLAPRSGSGLILSKKIMSVQGPSLNYGPRVNCEGSPREMSTGGSQSLSCKGILLNKKCVTDDPIVQIRAMGALSPLDPSSYSRPELAIIKHISLNLNVDFETHVLSGQAKIDFDVLQDINDLILDASKLKIESIEAEDGTQLQYKLGEHLANMGSKLTILLPKKLSAGEQNDEYTMTSVKDEAIPSKPCSEDRRGPSEKFSTTLPLTFNGFVFEPTMGCSKDRKVLSREASSTCCDDDISATAYQGYRLSVKVKYSTDPQASALQWLDPEQTSGKKHPYLFSQCQPIHARSILPCQDTPAVKFTYDAEVSAPEEFTVLMSALRGEQKSTKTTFRQPMPLPSYLVALAVGVLESRTLGPRSKVWSEKEEIERSAWEFSETEKYLQAAEKLCGPYEWTQYDLLVLPPSFPYGGMENPCLTFVTPTLLAGDRSQADVIVHEIMHSWTGNLVTNRNFEHFWLNEGFTVFLERKVGASLINNSVEAKRSRDFHSLLGLQELNEAIEVFGSTNPLTNLVVDLQGIHPDDAFSRVPYEKGSLFLRYLEDLVGGPEVFDDFLRAYLTKFRKKSLDTEQFQKFFVQYFKDNENLKKIDWDTWLHTSGMPPIIPDYDTTMTKAISALIVKLDDPTATISHDDVATFTPHQMIHMLQQLIDRPALSLDRLTALGTEYKVNGNKNTEILYRWLRLCIRSRDQSKISEVFNFVNSQGRMKYVRPIYRDLYAWEDVRERAIDNFLKNEKYMMHVSAYTLRKDLHLEENMTKE